MYGTAELVGPLCFADDDAEITNFVLQSQSRELPEPPEIARNHFRRQGLEGAKVFLVYFLKDPATGEPDPHWALVTVEARALPIVTGVRWDDARKCIVADVLEEAAVESCKDIEEQDVLCFGPCQTE
jgi:hypothetical protein